MTPEKNKKMLAALIVCFDGYKGDYEDGLDTLGFQELIQILDYKFRHEMGLSLELVQIPPITSVIRN